MIDFVDLDDVLRGTAIDAQDFANRSGMVVIVDADAATVGAPCWYGSKASAAEAVTAYIDSGGTASVVYRPLDTTWCDVADASRKIP